MFYNPERKVIKSVTDRGHTRQPTAEVSRAEYLHLKTLREIVNSGKTPSIYVREYPPNPNGTSNPPKLGIKAVRSQRTQPAFISSSSSTGSSETQETYTQPPVVIDGVKYIFDRREIFKQFVRDGISQCDLLKIYDLYPELFKGITLTPDPKTQRTMYSERLYLQNIIPKIAEDVNRKTEEYSKRWFSSSSTELEITQLQNTLRSLRRRFDNLIDVYCRINNSVDAKIPSRGEITELSRRLGIPEGNTVCGRGSTYFGSLERNNDQITIPGEGSGICRDGTGHGSYELNTAKGFERGWTMMLSSDLEKFRRTHQSNPNSVFGNVSWENKTSVKQFIDYFIRGFMSKHNDVYSRKLEERSERSREEERRYFQKSQLLFDRTQTYNPQLFKSWADELDPHKFIELSGHLVEGDEINDKILEIRDLIEKDHDTSEISGRARSVLEDFVVYLRTKGSRRDIEGFIQYSSGMIKRDYPKSKKGSALGLCFPIYNSHGNFVFFFAQSDVTITVFEPDDEEIIFDGESSSSSSSSQKRYRLKYQSEAHDGELGGQLYNRNTGQVLVYRSCHLIELPRGGFWIITSDGINEFLSTDKITEIVNAHVPLPTEGCINPKRLTLAFEKAITSRECEGQLRAQSTLRGNIELSKSGKTVKIHTPGDVSKVDDYSFVLGYIRPYRYL